MVRKALLTLIVLIGIAAVAAYARQRAQTPAAPNIPNPASVNCEKNGGKLELKEDNSGGTVGICTFPDGSVCEEWSYIHGNCQPGDLLATNQPTKPEPNIANPASANCEQNGGKLELTKDASGGSVGMCRFPDNSVCEEWAYYRGSCKPGDSLVTSE
jgi:putative hemolysin